ncbi:TetR/AcrR family transcriptional regulator C-terminal domain-containing protein [Cryptosporangium sp. NPDC048952]|uniref:TetR/AcrR family transcriptional regulator C-terminal domain-containing protein n=1 Tax=Cryptosporangium sp. NPDC048952 TaxID=3363961 RepID=UPI00371E4A18
MSAPRTPLSRERVLRAAIDIADAEGVEALTMRRLARAVDAEAMSLYHHVKNKDDVLDGVVDVIAGEINAAVEDIDGPDWKAAARERILTARSIFLRHPWAPPVFAGRTQVSFQVVLYHDRLVGLMHRGGFSYDLAHHALHALGSRALGFAQELFDPGDAGGDTDVPPEMAAAVPNLVGMLTEVAHDDPDSTLGWCDDQFEFEFGLDLVLDGLERLRTT